MRQVKVLPAYYAVPDQSITAFCVRRASVLPVGRPKGLGKSMLDKHRPEIEALLANGSTQKFIAKRYKSSPAKLANWMKKHGNKKPCCEILWPFWYLCIVWAYLTVTKTCQNCKGFAGGFCHD